MNEVRVIQSFLNQVFIITSVTLTKFSTLFIRQPENILRVKVKQKNISKRLIP